jgi:hypothetical protein
MKYLKTGIKPEAVTRLAAKQWNIIGNKRALIIQKSKTERLRDAKNTKHA